MISKIEEYFEDDKLEIENKHDWEMQDYLRSNGLIDIADGGDWRDYENR